MKKDVAGPPPSAPVTRADIYCDVVCASSQFPGEKTKAQREKHLSEMSIRTCLWSPHPATALSCSEGVLPSLRSRWW